MHTAPVSKGRRIAARAIDFAVILVVSGVLYFIGAVFAFSASGCEGGITGSCADDYASAIVGGLIAVAATLFGVFYETVFSPTLGKSRFGLRITMTDGQPVPRKTRMRRALILWAPLVVAAWGLLTTPESINGLFFLIWFGYLVYMLMAVLMEARPPHDRLTNTTVSDPDLPLVPGEDDAIYEPASARPQRRPEPPPKSPSPAPARRYRRRE